MGNDLRIAVTGGRDYADARRVNEILDLLRPGLLAHGDTTGADHLCRDWAYANPPIGILKYKADWAKHGRAAGPIRNRFMLDDFQPHMLVAFPGGRGTADCIKAAHERHIPVWCV